MAMEDCNKAIQIDPKSSYAQSIGWASTVDGRS